MPKVLRTHPFLGAIADRIAAYEKVRLGGKVPEATRAALRVPKHEYRLVTDKGGPGFQRVLLQPAHGVTDFGGKTNVWEVEVKEQPCRLAVEMVTSPERWAGPGPAYRSEKALLLDEFETLRPYGENDQGMDAMVIGEGKAGMTSQGVTQRFEAMAEGGPAGRFALYTATSTASNDQGWSAIGRRFEQPLDLSWHKGLGFWVRGDGHGGMLKLQLRDEAGGAFDFYLHNRFEGWRYIQVPRPEKDPIDYAKVRRLIFYYNGLPAKSTVSCGIDGVKALPALDEPVLDRPALEVDGQKVAWPVTLTGAQWLFAWPGEPTRVCAPGKETTLPAPPEMLLQPGRHTLRLTCGGPSPAATEVRVMLLPPERLPAQ